MNAKLAMLLEEALERYLMPSCSDKDLMEAWTGLGTLPKYRPALQAGLMEWVHGQPPPRCMGWLRLTEAGAEIVAEWLEEEA